MRDITLEDTIYLNFTTRSFSTGVPTVLSGSPALSVLESNNATPITDGVSLQTDRASVVGLNQATIVATAANGYEAGKSYSVYISAGTVGGVSVVGEVVGQFTIQASAAAVDLANATDGLGALKTEIGTRLATSGYTAPLDAAGTRSAVGLASANLDTQLGDLPTNAELAAALGTADDAVLAAIAALNNISEANIRAALGMVSANLDTQIGDLPTNAELAAALGAADDAVLAAIAALNNLSEANIRAAIGMASANFDTQIGDLPTNAELAAVLGAADDATLAQIALVKAKTDLIPAAPAAVGDAMTLTSAYDFAKGTVAITEAYRADGTAPTPAQALCELLAHQGEASISGTTKTLKKFDGSTTAATFTLDDATTPTSITRAT